MEITALGWALTIGVILALLALDLVVGTVRPHAVGFREAAAWSVFYIAVAVVFGLVFARQVGWGYGAEYFAGYIVEKSLSVDNLFVLVIIMSTFAVPREHRQRVLTFGFQHVHARGPLHCSGPLDPAGGTDELLAGRPDRSPYRSTRSKPVCSAGATWTAAWTTP